MTYIFTWRKYNRNKENVRWLRKKSRTEQFLMQRSVMQNKCGSKRNSMPRDRIAAELKWDWFVGTHERAVNRFYLVSSHSCPFNQKHFNFHAWIRALCTVQRIWRKLRIAEPLVCRNKAVNMPFSIVRESWNLLNLAIYRSSQVTSRLGMHTTK